MIRLLATLAQRLRAPVRIDADALAAELGRTEDEGGPNEPIEVVPHDREIAELRIAASDAGDVAEVTLRPATRLTVAMLAQTFGPYQESPRLHVGRPHRLVFAPAVDAGARYAVRLLAEVAVAAREPTGDSEVQEVTLLREPITTSVAAPTPSSVAATADRVSAAKSPVWPRLLGPRARFGVRSWRAATLDAVRAEIETAIGVSFVPSDDKIYDGKPAFACVMPACELRLNCWSTDAAEGILVFNLIGVPEEDLEAPASELVSDELAAYLRRGGHDWYVPDRFELLEEGGVLRERQLERDVNVAILGARWLAFCSPEERKDGIELLRNTVDLWLAAAKRAADPVGELMRRRAEFEQWGKSVAPARRPAVLAAYAVQEQLSVIEDELLAIREQPAEERASGAVRARLGELRELLPDLRESARELGIGSIERQYERVEAALRAVERDGGTGVRR